MSKTDHTDMIIPTETKALNNEQSENTINDISASKIDNLFEQPQKESDAKVPATKGWNLWNLWGTKTTDNTNTNVKDTNNTIKESGNQKLQTANITGAIVDSSSADAPVTTVEVLDPNSIPTQNGILARIWNLLTSTVNRSEANKKILETPEVAALTQKQQEEFKSALESSVHLTAQETIEKVAVETDIVSLGNDTPTHNE